MAVSYAAKVTTQDKLFFVRLLFRWSGSVWQFLLIDFIVYVVVYVCIAFTYRNYLFDRTPLKLRFDLVARWLEALRDSVPLSFLLGFFVTSVLGRWWTVCTTVPWVAGPAFFVQALLQPARTDRADIARKIRITVLRWLNIAWILMMGNISLHIKERFCFQRKSMTCSRKQSKAYKLTWMQRLDLINKDNKVKKYFGELITKDEMDAFSRSAELSNDDEYSYAPEFWLPLAWATKLIAKAKTVDCIQDDRHYMRLLLAISEFRSSLGYLWMLTEFNIPLVYTQVAVFAVYTYLFSGLISMQPINPRTMDIFKSTANASYHFGFEPRYNPMGYIPILASFEFIFYLGWFKIGMCLINPLGKDKEDIPLDNILDSNLKMSVKIGGCEDFLFPQGLVEGNQAEQQILTILNSFDFSRVRAHDKFETPEETEARLKADLQSKVKKQKKTELKHSQSKDSVDSDAAYTKEPKSKSKARKASQSQEERRQSTYPVSEKSVDLSSHLHRCSSDPHISQAAGSTFLRALLGRPKFMKTKKPEETLKASVGAPESIPLVDKAKSAELIGFIDDEEDLGLVTKSVDPHVRV